MRSVYLCDARRNSNPADPRLAILRPSLPFPLASFWRKRRLILAAIGTAMVLSVGQAAAQDRRVPNSSGASRGQTYRQVVPGLLVRTRYVTADARERRIELWDLLIGPGRRASPVRLPGAAVLEVRGGTGVIVVGDRTQALRPGASLALPEGARLQFVNTRRDLGLDVRATIIVGGPR